MRRISVVRVPTQVAESSFLTQQDRPISNTRHRQSSGQQLAALTGKLEVTRSSITGVRSRGGLDTGPPGTLPAGTILAARSSQDWAVPGSKGLRGPGAAVSSGRSGTRSRRACGVWFGAHSLRSGFLATAAGTRELSQVDGCIPGLCAPGIMPAPGCSDSQSTRPEKACRPGSRPCRLHPSPAGAAG
jgi:hypothetical protein